MKPVRTAIAALALPLLSLAGPAPSSDAVGAVRWAAAGGSGTACSEASPCSLDTAVEAAAVQDGDEVVVTPGSYTVTELDVTKAITLHGQAGQPVPTITTGFTIGVYVAAAATISDLHFVASVQSSAIFVIGGGATLERITSQVSAGGSTACSIGAATVVRDSVCWATGVNTKGLGANLSTGPATYAVTLRNVTAVGTTSGVGFDFSGPGVDFAIDAVNVIALSLDPNGADVRASAQNGASIAITLAHSSYTSEQEITNGGGVAATVTDPGTGTNQTSAPVFVNAVAGDFHQAAGSPTLDAGVLDASTGPTDFEGDARAIRATAACPALPDIGADERVTTLECDPPETTLTGPSGTTDDTTPTFQVGSDEPGSTFECRVDAAAYAACTSPYTTPVLALGTHTVEARAIDLSGNVDPTPATRSVTITSPAPAAAPETTLTQAPPKRLVSVKKRAKVTFAFSSPTPGTFQCSMDGAAFTACTSPTRVRLGRGKHTFSVRAVNPSGTVDPTPASVTFKIKVRKRR